MASESEIRVGVNVRFQYGHAFVLGNVKEDRGPIGKGGRKLFRVTFQSEPGYESNIELPASELQIVHHELLSLPH